MISFIYMEFSILIFTRDDYFSFKDVQLVSLLLNLDRIILINYKGKKCHTILVILLGYIMII